MITYSSLGQNGRLGNQMFQYAALYGVGFMRGYEIVVPPENHDLFKLFEITAIKKEHLDFEFLYKENDFSYEAKVNLIPDNTNLDGYFQSPFYWIHCEDSIRKEFTIKTEIKSHADLLISSEKRENRPLCSIHVRRSDYIEKSDYHHLQSLSYYKNAMKVVSENVPNVKFLCFSDDIGWCKENLGEELVYMHNHPYIDFACMSQCDVHIMANSSFSWWAAFLSNSGAVIAPGTWFGPSGPKNWESIYYPRWNKLEDK